MNQKKQDIRVFKTQRTLKNALFVLLKKQAFTKITIKSICEEAMVSRSTFYAHFEDKYKLLEFSLEELRRESFDENRGGEIKKYISHTLRMIQRHKKIFYNLTIEYVDFQVMEILKSDLVMVFSELLVENVLTKGKTNFEMEVITRFYATGLLQVIVTWLSEGTPVGTRQMTELLLHLFLPLEFEIPV